MSEGGLHRETKGRAGGVSRSLSRKTARRVVALVLVIYLVIVGSAEYVRLGAVNTYVGKEAQYFAEGYASQISARMFAHFDELAFIGGNLSWAEIAAGKLDASTDQAILNLLRYNKDIPAVNILDGDGNKILWSTAQQSSTPITAPKYYRDWGGNPKMLLATPLYSQRFRRIVLSTCYRVELGGKTLFFVGAPYSLSGLLELGRKGLPFNVELVFFGQRSRVFQVNRDGLVLPVGSAPKSSFLGLRTYESLSITGAPWRVYVGWSRSFLIKMWLAGSGVFWLLYAFGGLLLLALAIDILRKIERGRLLLGFEKARAEIERVGLSGGISISDAIKAAVASFAYLEVVLCAMVVHGEGLENAQELGSFHREGDLRTFSPILIHLVGHKSDDTSPSTFKGHGGARCLNLLDLHTVGGDDLGALGRLKVFHRTLGVSIGPSGGVLSICVALRKSSYLSNSCEREISELVATLENTLRLIQSNARGQYVETMYKALSVVGEVVPGAKTEADLVRECSRSLVENLFFQGVGFLALNEEGLIDVIAAEGASAIAAIERVQSSPDLIESTSFAKVWRDGGVIVDGSLQHNPEKKRFFDLYERYGLHSLVIMAVDVDGERRAVMFLLSDQIDFFEGEMLDLCRRLVQLVGRGIAEIELKRNLNLAREREFRLAREDPLTLLPNRLGLENYLERTMGSQRRTTARYLIGVIDIDNFKPINDSFGHHVGDRVLIEFGRRLRESLGSNDFAARLGGDEFVVVLEVNGEAKETVERLEATCARTFEVGSERNFAFIHISLGFALYPDDGLSPDVLLRRADVALYRSKAKKMKRSRWWERWSRDDDDQADLDAETEGANETHEGEILSLNTATLLPVLEQLVVELVTAIQRGFDEGRRVGYFSEFGLLALTDLFISYLDLLVRELEHSSECEALERSIANVFAYMGVSRQELEHLLQRLTKNLEVRLSSAELEYGSSAEVTELFEIKVLEGLERQFETVRSTNLTARQVSADTTLLVDAQWNDALKQLVEKLSLVPGLLSLCALTVTAEGTMVPCRLFPTMGGGYETLKQFLEDIDGDRLGVDLVGESWKNVVITTQNIETGYLVDSSDSSGWIRTIGVVPVYDSSMKPIFVVVFAGEYLDMFDAPLGRQLLLAIQSRLSTLYQTSQLLQDRGGVGREIRLWRESLYSGGLEMYFQPIVDLKTGEMREVEGLARLVLMDGSVVGPNHFIPALSERELEYLLKKGTEKAILEVDEISRVVGDVSLSINIHPKSLMRSDLTEWLREAVSNSPIGPYRLKLELLESDELLNSPQIQETLSEIKSLGVKLSMDDFGSGHSNISRLKEIEFNGVKIDQLVLRGVYQDPLRVLDLLGMAVMLGRDLGLEVTVEGIEDMGSLEMVAQLGAHRGQGYVIARPMPKAELLRWYREFTPIRRSRSPRYPLGALASHWRFMHSNATLIADESLCPLQLFIERNSLKTSPLGEFHRMFHVSIEEQDRSAITSFSKSLMTELARMCMSQGTKASLLDVANRETAS